MKTILLTILIFAVMIMIHECGHFFAAKLFHVRVIEFSIGMGPKLFSKQGAQTMYSIRALPIGGYVSMEGEDVNNTNIDEETDDEISQEPTVTAEDISAQTPLVDVKYSGYSEHAFCNQKPWKRFIIIAMGAIMNLILGVILLVFALAPNESFGTNTIAKFQENAVSCDSGLQVGDTIKKINGRRIFVESDIVSTMLVSKTSDMDFLIERDGKKIQLNNVHFDTKQGEQKEELFIDFMVNSQKNTPLNTLGYSLRRGISMGQMVWFSFVDLVSGNIGFSQLSGPVGVGSIIGKAAAIGMSSILNLTAFLSINLGIFNLLPVPALDGGRLFFIIFEMIFRKPINKKVEAMIHAGGMILLFGLTIVIMLKDIWGLF